MHPGVICRLNLSEFFIFQNWQAVAEVVQSGPNTPYKPGQALMYLQFGAFSDYKVGCSYGCRQALVRSYRQALPCHLFHFSPKAYL